QARTAGLGSGFIASETTFVSKTIIQTSWVLPAPCRAPGPTLQNHRLSALRGGQAPPERRPCGCAFPTSLHFPESRAPPPLYCGHARRPVSAERDAPHRAHSALSGL